MLDYTLIACYNCIMFEPNRGKKPHKFTYTYKDISIITGLKIGTLRSYASRGIFDPYNLEDVVRFIDTHI